ncbi:MAG: crotonase/enoyl-CoA hydratase family protein [Nitrospirae bacterium]|nr:crotonase/enoyl-CoA hydratase family protein [Nitrospirota bacterium]
MAKENASYERRGAAAILRITRPERRNAVDSATAKALLSHFREFERDESARVLIVTGDDKAFCAGWDLKAADSATDPDEGPMGFTRVFSTKPTIAAINGYCVAGGLEIALWCDLRIAATDSAFGCFERRWGVPLLDGGTQRLARVIGLSRALELILLGRAVDAEEALRFGLANAVVPPAQVLEKAVEWAELIASFPQETLLADREAAIKGFGLPLDQGLALERRLGLQTVAVALKGAARFSGGAGRHGAGVPGGQRPDPPAVSKDGRRK